MILRDISPGERCLSSKHTPSEKSFALVELRISIMLVGIPGKVQKVVPGPRVACILLLDEVFDIVHALRSKVPTKSTDVRNWYDEMGNDSSSCLGFPQLLDLRLAELVR